ncbi:MAG: glycosyltransferase involved in cell wall biosynthesis [Planctomycetota bacterium]|jgi:glycosyltransferase involved in cell wall biosynthesis
MRVLYHHRTQAEDGQAVHVRSLLRAFESLGHEVWEVGLVKHGTRAPESESQGAEGQDAASTSDGSSGRERWGWVTRLPRFARELAEYGYNGIARRRLVGEAARFEPDFIYERYAFGNAAGVLASKRTQRPLILEVNSPMVDELSRTRGLSFPKFASKLESWIFRSADRVCVVTAVLGDMLVELGVERERLLVTPNGVDLDLYEYGDRAQVRAEARRSLGLPPEEDGEVVLGFTGYYRPWHRLDLALNALLEPSLERARLVLIGEGPAHEELEQHALKLGVRDRLTFAGRRPHHAIPGLLPAFDLALVPAINPYASPLKLHEYMAASLPTIAPDQPNLREVLVDDRDALLVAPDDGDAFGQAILKLSADGDLRARLGRAARRTIIEGDMTWEGNARRVCAMAQELQQERAQVGQFKQ